MLKYRLFLIVVLVTLLLVGCKAKETPTPATPEPTTETSIPTPTSWVQDVIAPAMVIDRSPEPGAELATDASIVLVFNQPMDRRAVESSFSIEPKVAGSFQWSDDQQLKFIPDKSLPRAGQYQVSLTSDATAATGAALRDYSFDFNTVGFLQVAQVSPPEGSSGVEPDSHIIVIFNRPVVPLATLNDQANFPHPLTLDPSIKGKGEWINTSIYEFVPDGNFPGGTRITASVPAGFKDLTGGILPEDHSWSFTTSPPVVTWHVPSVNAQQVPIADPISITFNQPVDLNSAREKIRVTDSSGTQVPGRITTDGAQVAFEPEGDLAFDEMYTVKIEPGLTSSSGGAGMEEEYSWHFNTVPLPRILSTDPRDGETRVHPQHRGFKIQFNTDIVPSTVMEHVSITPAITATEVSTWFSRWDDSFWIHFDFLPATEYQVKIEPGIKDAYGNETPDALDVTFTTRDYDPELRLITSGLVNTYDAYEPARLQVVYRNISGIDFKLYRLTADEYFKVEAEWERYTPAVGSLIREWSMPVERVPNSTEIVNINLLEDGGALEPGLYFLSSYSPEINNINYYWGYNHHLLVVTKTNLTLKWTEDQLLVWATDLQSGQPVSGLELKLITSGVERQTLFTDQDGVALLESVPRYKSELWVLSDEDGDRFSMASQWWDQGLSPWDFGFASGDYSMVERAHIYTDRPIYRPDQTVYYRGLVKMEDDARYHPLKQRQIQVTIKDPEYNDVFNELVTLNDNDAFSGELILAEDAPLGRYMIEISKDRYKSYGMSTFMVAAYRPPEFEVKVTPSMDEITVGESSKWATQVQTFFGSPVSDAELEWALIASPYSFDGPGNYSYDEVDDPWIMYRSWWGEPQAEKTTIAGGKGRTDAQGMFLLDSPLDEIAEAVEKDGSLIVTFEVMVYGPDGSVISGRSQMVVHKGDYYVGVAASERIAQAGEPIQIDLITVEWPKAGQQLVNDGRLEGREITVELYRIEGESVYVRDEQGFGRWTWEQKEIFIERKSAVTDDLGEASVQVTAPDAGSYRVKAISVDDSSRSIRSSTFFWAMGPGKVRWRIEDNNRVNLISNKDSYVPGEIAEILIPSPFEGPQTALVTIERADIKSYELIQMEGNTHVLHIPVTSDYAPNVYVSVVIAVEKNESNPRAEFR
ncbi:MAG: Ig-like domain-containing protein, partial [Chloroflexota bacterium]